MNIKKLAFSAAASGMMLGSMVLPAFAAAPGAAVKNDNANKNACWGMDRAYYASQGYFPENMDIKQSFLGEVGPQLQAWIGTYCDPHGPTE